MSLSGALESFPVVEVLRLIGRTAKTGVLRVDAEGLEARMYASDGVLTYATTRRDEEFHARLVEAHMVDPKAWVEVERRERTVSDILAQGASQEKLSEFMLDQIADVIFRVVRQTNGRFAFNEEVTPRFDTGVSLDIDICIQEAQARLKRWQSIEEVVPSVAFHLRLNPAAVDHGQVQVSEEEWKVLCTIAGEGSVEEVSRKRGWSEFRAAELMAGMVRRGMLMLAEDMPDGRYTYGEEQAAPGEPESSYFEVIGPKVRPSKPEPGTTDEKAEIAAVITEIADGERAVADGRNSEALTAEDGSP